MGQTIGKAPLATPEVAHLANLPRACVLDLWEAFNDVAEGFGLTIIEFREMLQCSLKEYLGFTDSRLTEVADVVFSTFDDDKNHLIDALECLASLAIMSGMTIEQKIRYIFGIYDFDESGVLSVDETILALRSTISGLCKLCGLDPPLESEIEVIALMAFQQSAGQEEEAAIDAATFTVFCQKTPEVTSWIQYCGAVHEVDVSTPTFTDSDAAHVLAREKQRCYRPQCHTAGTDMDSGLAAALAQEEKGPSIDLLPQEAWRGTAAFTEPSAVPRKLPSSAPESNLELQWAFGFNSTASRGAVHYTAKGNVVVGAGSAGVVTHQGGQKQQFFLGHSDMVSCLAVHRTEDPNFLAAASGATGQRKGAASTIVCSGEFGARPRVCVWCAETCEVLSVFRGFHTEGVCQVCFSPDGQLIVSVGKDLAHSVAVFHWQSRTTLFTAPSGPEPVLGCHVVHENLFVSCGVDHLRLWTRVGGSFEVEKGIFGRKGARQPMLCCISLGDEGSEMVLTGSTSGHLYVWEGRNCTRCIKAHTGAIMAMARGDGTEHQGLATGSADGKVQLWTSSLEMAVCIDVKALGPVSHMIHSLSWDIINHKMLVATDSCEIYEILDSDGTNLHRGPMAQGHFGHGVRGLAVHPTDPNQFASAGADRTVRVWNREQRKMVKMCVLDTPAQCVCYNPDGTMLAVGLGGGLASDPGEWNVYGEKREQHAGETPNETNKKDGAWVALREKDLTVVHEARDSKMPVSAIRWSPDGGTLAVASEDSFVYLYNCGDYIAKAKCGGHNGPVTHLDFSCDGQYVQCDSQKGGELLFFDTERGDQMTPANLRDTEWETQTCVVGWPLQGGWGTLVDGCVLTVAARANNGEQLVLADGFGRVRLLRYPAVNDDQDFRQYRGHGCPVRNCGFLADDESLVTSGGRDCALLLWAFEARADAEGAGMIVDSTSSSSRADGSGSGRGKGGGERDLYEDDPDVETIAVAEEDRLRHPDLRDLSRWDQDRRVDRTKNGDSEATMLMEENADEEHFGPTKPWHRAVAAPSSAPPEDTRAPDNDLVLEWVHGYRGHDCRNAAMYTASGEVLFFAGSLVVRQDVPKKAQRFFTDHTDEVLCFDTHPSRPLAASGQRGRLPKIIVWEMGEMRTVRVLEGYHRRAVTTVKFSPDGRLLATMGADDHHGLAVYDWENSVLLCTTRTGPAKTFSLGFTINSDGLILCADGTVDFWTIQGGQNMTRRPASLGPFGKRQLFLCQGWDGTNPVVGTFDGHIYRFLGRRLDSLVKAHTTEVFALCSTGEGLVSGGADGYVKIWGHNLQPRHQLNLLTSSLNPSIRSVSWHTSNDKILVGTAGNELFEFNATSGDNLHEEGKPLLRGHAAHELWGLSCHPSAPEFCTVGEDKQLRIWDIYSKRPMRCHEVEMPSRAVAYSPDGSKIAVGFGMPIRESSKQFDGKWIVLQEDDFQVLHAARDSQKHITDIKWAPSGQSLAMGAADGKVYVYNTDEKYVLAAMLTTHNSPIVAIDFSTDGRYVRSTCQAYELFSHEADTGMVIPAASRLKNVQWDTQTVLFGWASQGAWPPELDGTEVMSIDATLNSEHLSKAVAAGDNLGRIRLLRQPCTSPYADSKSYRAHSAGITRLRWSMGQSHLISIGMEDRCVMQWRHERDDLAAKEASRPNPAVASAATSGTAREGPDAPKANVGDPSDPSAAAVAAEGPAPEDSDADPEADVLGAAGQQGGGLSSASNGEGGRADDKNVDRPWVKNMIEPSYALDLGNDTSTPKQSVSLASVHGIRSQGLARGSLAYNRVGGLVYPAATIGVVYSRKTHSQGYFRGHAGKQITFLRVSPNQRFVASGEAGTRPTVRVWDAATSVELCTLPHHHRQGIASLAFSKDGRRLATVGVDSDKSLAVWRSCSGEWYDAELQATGKGGRGFGHVFFAEFSHSDDDELRVITGGVGHVKFWALNGRLFNARMGLFGKVGKRQTMLCGTAIAAARFVSGGVSGHLYVWKGRWLEKTLRAHQRCINSVHHTTGGLVTGGKDGFVKLWSTQLAHLKTFDLSEATVPPLLRGVRSVCASLDVTGSEVIKIAAVTAGSEVYEISRESGSMMLLQEGHFSGQLWGLAAHPTDGDIFATAGDDHSIRVWSVSLGVMLRKAYVDGTCRALGWSPDGRLLLIGMGGSIDGERTRKDGTFLIFDVYNMEILYEGRDSRSWIRACCFSPDGKSFAVASTDNKIYIYDSKSYALKAKAQKHNSPLVALDFSEDSNYVQSASEDNELLYHSAGDGLPFAVQAQLKHIKWSQYTCPFGWPVQGAWPPVAEEDAATLTSLHRSHDRTLLVTADDAGNVKLFRYPALSKQAGYKLVSGHVGGISCVRFTADDAHIVSIGKGDRAIFVWKVDEAAEGLPS